MYGPEPDPLTEIIRVGRFYKPDATDVTQPCQSTERNSGKELTSPTEPFSFIK